MSIDELIENLTRDLDYSHRVVKSQNDVVCVLVYSESRPVLEIIKIKHFSDQVRMLALRSKAEISAARYGRIIKIIKNKIGYQVVRSMNVLVADDLSNVDQIFYEYF